MSVCSLLAGNMTIRPRAKSVHQKPQAAAGARAPFPSVPPLPLAKVEQLQAAEADEHRAPVADDAHRQRQRKPQRAADQQDDDASAKARFCVTTRRDGLLRAMAKGMFR